MASRCMHTIYDQLAGHEIIVRRAAKDEKFVTLDESGAHTG